MSQSAFKQANKKYKHKESKTIDIRNIKTLVCTFNLKGLTSLFKSLQSKITKQLSEVLKLLIDTFFEG
jgi:hypothetical protein